MAKVGYVLVNILISYTLTNLVYGQSLPKDTLSLDGVVISAPQVRVKLNNLPGQLLDWAVQPLSEISYKTYGAAGVGSISFRGLPANQTSLLWRGLSLGSPLLGQVDLGQLTITEAWAPRLADKPSLVHTGNAASSVWVGQPLFLSDSSQQRSLRAQAHFTIGLYGLRVIEGAVTGQANRWRFSVRLLASRAQNDFRIYRPAGADPLLPRFQGHAMQSNFQAEGVAAYQSRRQNYLVEMSALTNEAQRQLPPPITKYSSAQQLQGQTLAFVINQRFGPKAAPWAYKLATGTLLDHGRYIDDAGSPNIFTARQLQLLGRFSAVVGKASEATALSLEHTHAIGIAPSYGRHQALQVHSIQAGCGIARGRFRLDPTANYFLVQGASHAAIGLDVSFKSETLAEPIIRFTSKPLFRAPTLNDLYYPGLGNPNLRPERGRLYEFALALATRSGAQYVYTTEIVPFVYDYQRFILWQPQGNLWTPTSLIDARVSGITGKATFATKQGLWHIDWMNQATISQGGLGGAWFQLSDRPSSFLYTPALRLTSSLVAKQNNDMLSFQAAYTGQRPIVTDQSAGPMPGFMIYTLALSRSEIAFWAGRASVAVQVHVASRPDYAWVPNYAAPRWWGQLSFSYGLATRS